MLAVPLHNHIALPRELTMRTLIGLVATLLFAGSVLAQQQPYANLQTRSIKTLSDQQIADLNAGRGMGLALAAELNGYPGPIHAIELAGELHLSPEQITKLRALFEAMKAEAIPLGASLISQERELNNAFANRTITLANFHAKDRHHARRTTSGAFEISPFDGRNTHSRASNPIQRTAWIQSRRRPHAAPSSNASVTAGLQPDANVRFVPIADIAAMFRRASNWSSCGATLLSA